MDLDDKIANIIKLAPDEDGYVEFDVLERAVSEIKQAFADAGYIQFTERVLQDDGKGMRIIETLPKAGMSGSEWFSRFEKELFKDEAKLPPGEMLYGKNRILVAARRASGIDKEGEGHEN